jgi:hypothetical protein
MSDIVYAIVIDVKARETRHTSAHACAHSGSRRDPDSTHGTRTVTTGIATVSLPPPPDIAQRLGADGGITVAMANARNTNSRNSSSEKVGCCMPPLYRFRVSDFDQPWPPHWFGVLRF